MSHTAFVRRKRVVIVHQERQFALRLADWLATEGHEAVIVPGAGELMEIVHETEPDLILLDLTTRSMTDEQERSLIRHIVPDEPVLITSGSDLP
jgi:DNA-binding NtrC family response regulator